jgi:hypothetical protein
VRKLKRAGVPPDDILKFYFMKLRPVLESLCPVFHSMLTIDDQNELERIQKIVFKIILGPRYDCYENACEILDVETLNSRRHTLSLNFALKVLDSPQNFFKYSEKTEIFLRKQPIIEEPFAHTDRYKRSPLPALVKFPNDYFNTKIDDGDFINIPSRYFPITQLNNGL